MEVAVVVPVRRTFTYRWPERERARLRTGTRVVVPVGRRLAPGFVLGGAKGPAPSGIREVERILDEEPMLDQTLLPFLRRASDYYLHPLGDVLQAALPPRLQAKRTLVYCITETGKRSARLLEGPTPEGRALRSILGGPRTLRGLLSRTPGLTRANLDRLVREGILDRRERISTGRDAATEVDVVVRASGDASARLGMRQRQILERIDASGEAPLPELRAAVPGAAAAVRGLVRKGLVRVERRAAPDPFSAAVLPVETPLELNAAQESAVGKLLRALDGGSFAPFLLHGVTGSGKTEVYLRLIATALGRGRGALALVPEISLTPQLVARFRARLGDDVAVLHSGLGDAERLDAWRALRTGRTRVAVGARSALFAPVQKVAVIVVDEEHDSSFKQEEGFRYHARDLALLRGQLSDAVVVLGSATPSLESYANAQRGKIGLLELPDRATPRALPSVELVDLKRHRMGPTGQRLLTAPLVAAMREALGAGGQVILFLNRRGYAPSVTCEECGEAIACPRCSVALVHHRASRALRCHYCDHAREMPERCPTCEGGPLGSLGAGTEQVEAAVREGFPDVRVGRLDRDVASGRGAERVLRRLRERSLDVLVGTQMVAKGHDFPGVTLVGVLAADVGLHMPDFRASERTFQLLCQVAGRAGRGLEPGRVVVQALAPGHHAVRLAAAHDFGAFFRMEAARRADLAYPPHGRLVAIVVEAAVESRARSAAEDLGDRARLHAGEDVVVLGPAPAPLARIRGRWRFRLLLRSRRLERLRACISRVEPHLADLPSGVRAALDIDPVSML